jgi:hypothetical protein
MVPRSATGFIDGSRIILCEYKSSLLTAEAKLSGRASTSWKGRSNPVVQFLDLATMRVGPLATIRRAIQRGSRGMAVSPDGSQFLYVEDDLTLSDVMLIENLL